MSQTQIKVELRPYQGKEVRRGKLRDATRPQKWVWLTVGDDDAERVGIVSDKPGSRFCATIPLSDFDDAELDAINAAIKESHGEEPPVAVGIPANTDSDSDDSNSDDDDDFIDDNVFVERVDDDPAS